MPSGTSGASLLPLSLLLSSVAQNCTWNIFFSFFTPQTLQVLPTAWPYCPECLLGLRISEVGKMGAMLGFFHSINW